MLSCAFRKLNGYLIYLFSFLTVCFLLASGGNICFAQTPQLPRTTQIFINGNGVISEVPKMGKVTLSFDVRPIGAAKVYVAAFLMPIDPQDNSPIQEWTIDKSWGLQELSFRKMPVGIYKIAAVALDNNGTNIATPSREVTIRYGGLKAWDEYNLRREKFASPIPKPLPFSGIRPALTAKDMPILTLDPSTTTVTPGDTVTITLTIKEPKVNNPYDDNDKKPEYIPMWLLDGPGTITVLNPKTVLYTSPKDGQHTANVRCTLKNAQTTEVTATVFVSKYPLGLPEY